MSKGPKRSEFPTWRFSQRSNGWNFLHSMRASTSCFMSVFLKAVLSSRSGMMKFDDLDQKMREFETTADLCVLPGIFMVARLDGRSFTRLTKEVCQFEPPFDERFR